MVTVRIALAALSVTLFGSLVTADKNFERRTAAPAIHRRFTPDGSTDNTNTCTELELVWFRSGFEPQGPSLGLMGDPLFKEILKVEPKSSGYNVRYDSSLYENILSSQAGADDAVRWITRRSTECPNQRYFVAGYSKGTLPVHAMQKLPDSARERVVASLVVGDYLHQKPWVPLNAFNTSWPSNGDYSIKSLCNVNDQVCWPGGTNHEIHLHPAYLPQLPAAVRWMHDLYKRNLEAPFPKVRGKFNH